MTDDRAVEIPRNLGELWHARLERVLRTRPTDDSIALELAAALGQEVDGEEWRDACEAEGIGATDGLVEQLVARRLAVAGATDCPDITI